LQHAATPPRHASGARRSIASWSASCAALDRVVVSELRGARSRRRWHNAERMVDRVDTVVTASGSDDVVFADHDRVPVARIAVCEPSPHAPSGDDEALWSSATAFAPWRALRGRSRAHPVARGPAQQVRRGGAAVRGPSPREARMVGAAARAR
jgi:hypothetical protein